MNKLNKRTEEIFNKWVTNDDFVRSYSTHCLPDIIRMLTASVDSDKVHRMIDIGCGFGGIGATIGEILNCQEVHGVDIDNAAVQGAKQKNLIAHTLDIDNEPLPYKDDYFDLVTSFGVFDYFPFFDPVIKETRRVLKTGGYVCISLPNLASWHNRLGLLMGYQPRDIEVSNEVMVGVHGSYKARGDKLVGHIHTVTTNGFVELMEYYGFETTLVEGVNTLTREDGPLLGRWLNKLINFVASPNLSKRFVYVGRLTSAPLREVDGVAHWRASSSAQTPSGKGEQET